MRPFAPWLFALGAILYVFGSADAYWQSRLQVAISSGGTHQVVVDAANCNPATKQYKTSGATQTLTGVTITAGSNLALVVPVVFDTGTGATTPTVTSLVWDVAGANQSLSLIKKDAGSGIGSQSLLYGLVGVTAGASKTITLTTTASSAVFLDACAFTGVDQTGGTTSFPNSVTNNNVTTISVTTATGDIVMAAAWSASAFGTPTGTIIFSDSTSGSVINAYSNYDSGASPLSIGASGTAQQIVATDIKAF